MWSLILLLLVAGPGITVAVLARQELRAGHLGSGVVLGTLAFLWLLFLMVAAAGAAASILGGRFP